MAKRITVDPETILQEERSGETLCKELEDGNILFFPTMPIAFPQEDISFLLSQKQNKAAHRKNIAYKPHINAITNADQETPLDAKKLLDIMRRFSQNATSFVQTLLSPYALHLKLDYASFRPFQEKGRELRRRARNDLLHFDAFPTRPMRNGTRILRFFVNINPEKPRQWNTSENFDILAKRFAGGKGIRFPKPSNNPRTKWKNFCKVVGKKAGLPVNMRSPYDEFMIRFHHFLKENEEFQKNTHKDRWDFPPFSCWMVFTDYVSHAALEGQYALEQTFLLPKKAMLNPEKSPISILEILSGELMGDPSYS